jgi:hypothetical protein
MTVPGDEMKGWTKARKTGMLRGFRAAADNEGQAARSEDAHL